MEVIQPRQGRSRRSHGARPASVSLSSVGGERPSQLAFVLLLVAAVSALGNLISLLVLAGAMGQTDSPQGAQTFLPVFAGALLGIAGDLVLARGALGILRPGSRLGGGRSLVMVGLLLQIPAAAAAGTLEALWPATVAYLLLLAALAWLWLRAAPEASGKPLARHPEEPPRRRAQITSTGRWTVAAPPPPMQWRAGAAPPPPSAPGQAVGAGGRDLPSQLGGRRP